MDAFGVKAQQNEEGFLPVTEFDRLGCGLFQPPLEKSDDQMVTIGEMPVERRPADPRLLADEVERHGDAMACEDEIGRSEDDRAVLLCVPSELCHALQIGQKCPIVNACRSHLQENPVKLR